jgi:hypothetical protein
LPIEIKAFPDIPSSLIEAATRGTLVPFIGAGVSQLAGCPRWSEFADKVLDHLVQKAVLTPAQRSQLSALTPRVKLSVAKIAAQREGIEIDYASILQKTADWHANQSGREIYGHISALSKRFVTTNYDEWLDLVFPRIELGGEEDGAHGEDRREELKRKKLHRPEDMTADNFREPNTVVHLHGALEDPEGMILSTRDYLERYANDRHRVGGEGENRVLSFLEFLFKTKNILFIGYGLEELEILEYVILKTGQRDGQRDLEPRHYILQGFFSFESDICHALQEYFLKQCGIQLIPFSRDKEDWRQLIQVLEKFASALPENDPMIAQDLKDMEALING